MLLNWFLSLKCSRTVLYPIISKSSLPDISFTSKLRIFYIIIFYHNCCFLKWLPINSLPWNCCPLQFIKLKNVAGWLYKMRVLPNYFLFTEYYRQLIKLKNFAEWLYIMRVLPNNFLFTEYYRQQLTKSKRENIFQ